MNFENKIERMQIKNDMVETLNENNLKLIDALREKEVFLYDTLLRQQDAPYNRIINSESCQSFKDELNEVIFLKNTEITRILTRV